MSISKKLRNSKGFTLVELLVVIAIIGILATLLLLQLGTARAKARDARRIADVSQLRVVAELYADDNAGFPAGTGANGIMNVANLTSYISGTTLPKDPSSGADYPYAWLPSGTVASKYHIWADLERSNLSAFRADGDINSTDAGPWGATAEAGTAQVNASVAGAEACGAAANDCLYDLGIQ